ncbi:MAG: carboxypeptidase regulatory-like domain-containing protein [Deltaproteobacteria bacterium]|nr:carboxypeptidase regulatory-like domain-containing protein [Deltaproteobacteria bacterium]
MRRWIAITAAVGVVLAVAAWLWGRGTNPNMDGANDNNRGSGGAPIARRRTDPTTAVRGAIAGTVTDDAARPIAGAFACAAGTSDDWADDLMREPVCATTDAAGRYAIEGLLPARYEVTASAPQRIPESHDPIGIAGGQRATGIDIALREGGVELVGTVVDVTGGPIAGALVVGASSPMSARTGTIVAARTDARGRFAMCVTGTRYLSAYADGYASASTVDRAPADVRIVMTPEATLAGTVVDGGTRKPVEGARVLLEPSGGELDNEVQSTFTDARGEFRFRGLVPGRVVATAYADHAFGRTAGSILVGLAQRVAGVEIEAWPASRVEAHVSVAGGGRCRRVLAYLGPYPMHLDGDRLVADGVLPGTYAPQVWCDERPPVEQAEVRVAGDVTGLRWEVPRGGSVRGTVRLRDGTPVAGARIWLVQSATRMRVTTSRSDGGYAFHGAALGESKLVVDDGGDFSIGDGEPVTIGTDAVAQRDLVVVESAMIRGVVVDEDGGPVAKVLLTTSNGPSGGHAITGDTGAFTMHDLRAGNYTITAPGGSSATVQLRDGQVATVRLTVPARRGVIRGVVRSAGAPVSDAYVVAVRDDGSGAARALAAYNPFGRNMVLTATDGSFAIGRLQDGAYLVRAYRRGGGEAFAERVAIGAGVTLDLAPTGSIAGIVRGRDGRPIEEIELSLLGAAMSFRTEQFHRTGGRYRVEDLPAGRYTIVVETSAGRAERDAVVAAGTSTTVDLSLAALVAITGRLVDLRTRTPIAGAYVGVAAFGGAPRVTSRTDGAGRFRIERLTAGSVRIWWGTEDVAFGFGLARVPAGEAATDVGDVPVLRPRAARDAGDPGFTHDDDLRVTSISPAAASSGLVVGDTLVAVDGLALDGDHRVHASAALRAPPGTSISLRLARGATVTITVGATPTPR